MISSYWISQILKCNTDIYMVYLFNNAITDLQFVNNVMY